MRPTLALILALPFLVLLAVLGIPGLLSGQTRTESGLPDPLRLLEDAADLVLLRVGLDQTHHASAHGYTGSTTVTGRIRGTLLIGCDLTRASVLASDRDRCVIELEIPQPTVMHVSIDHQASRGIASRAGLWLLAPGEAHEARLTQQLYEETVTLVRQRELDPHLVARAQTHCLSVLEGLLNPRNLQDSRENTDPRWRLSVRWVR